MIALKLNPVFGRPASIEAAVLADGRWPRPPEVPYLRLRGYWLQRAGFSAGQRVKVHVADGCITIGPAQ
jgi:hypothetical protein